MVPFSLKSLTSAFSGIWAGADLSTSPHGKIDHISAFYLPSMGPVEGKPGVLPETERELRTSVIPYGDHWQQITRKRQKILHASTILT